MNANECSDVLAACRDESRVGITRVREGEIWSELEGRKDDSGKTRYDLIPADAIEILGHVYTVGAEKYADRNWEKGMSWGRVFAAVMRHLWAFWRGEDFDRETHIPHTAHAAWGCLTLTAYLMRGVGTDNRGMEKTQCTE